MASKKGRVDGGLSSQDAKELARLRAMFDATPNMAECRTCNHWYQPTGNDATLYPCERPDHVSKECPKCKQMVCGEWTVKRAKTPEYLAFMKATAAGGVFQECCVCARYFPYKDAMWCNGHEGCICREHLPEWSSVKCAVCCQDFCSLCVADDMKTCPGRDCHNQLCLSCQEDDGRCEHCTTSGKPSPGKKNKVE